MQVFRPSTLEEALRLKAEHPGARPLQGGTDVLVELTFGHSRPDALLDLSELVELRGFTEEDGVLRLGSGLTYTEAMQAPLAARLPALAEASISHAWAGLYEVSPDANPIIGPAHGVNGLFLINGFSGHGFQHSPAAGRILADVIAGRDPQFDLRPFAADRFVAGLVAGERYFV